MEQIRRTATYLLLLAALFWTAGDASAQKKPTKPQGCGTVTITDAAGRTHKVMKMHCITQAERNAAAKRARAMAARVAAERQKGLQANKGGAK